MEEPGKECQTVKFYCIVISLVHFWFLATKTFFPPKYFITLWSWVRFWFTLLTWKEGLSHEGKQLAEVVQIVSDEEAMLYITDRVSLTASLVMFSVSTAPIKHSVPARDCRITIIVLISRVIKRIAITLILVVLIFIILEIASLSWVLTRYLYYINQFVYYSKKRPDKNN